MAKVPRNLLPQAFNRGGNPANRSPSTPVSKIGRVDGITDRNVAKGEPITPTPGLGDNRTQVDTYFTAAPVIGQPVAQIYTGDRFWARITLTLETAGPVAIGTSTKIAPVLGGGGRLLVTGQQVTFTVAKGTRLFVSSTGVNRIGRVIEPLPWLEQIAGLVGLVAERLAGFAAFATGKR